MICEKPLRGKSNPATGTDAGYQRHWRANEIPCDLCNKAHIRHVIENQATHPHPHKGSNGKWRENNPNYFENWRKLHPSYNSWKNMNHRCYDTNHRGYERWGGRGISVCNRWRESYENFIQDMGERPSSSHSIDRIDNDGNYEPNNCRWATAKEQRANRRTLTNPKDCFVRANIVSPAQPDDDLKAVSLRIGDPISLPPGFDAADAILNELQRMLNEQEAKLHPDLVSQ